jgi:hypothetical protein
VQPPTVTDDDPPFSRWIAEDPLLISQPPDHECFGDDCAQGPVATLLRNGGYRSVLTVKKRLKLSVSWVVMRAGKFVTLGSERATFRKPGTYRPRFVLTRKGRSVLRSTRGLQFLVAGWIATPPRSDTSGCGYSGRITAAREIRIAPNCGIPPDETDPF